MDSPYTTKPRIERIEKNPGILVEKLDTVKISTTTWTIIQKINLRPYFQRGDQLLQAQKILAERCSTSKEKCFYKTQLEGLKEKIQDTRRDTGRIIGILRGHETQMKRQKRAWFSVIGKISRTLFGTLDEEAEVELKTLIEMSTNDTRKLANLVANQTELIAKEFDQTADRLMKLEIETEKIQALQLDVENSAIFTAAMELLAENVLQFELDTETLMDAILFATQGTVHPKFIPPEQIEQTADLVVKTVSTAEFPGTQSIHSISEIVKISELTIIFTDYCLIYHLQLPLLEKTDYQLYKATPIPISQEATNVSDTFAYIWPENQFFAISQNTNTYIPLTEYAISKCGKLGKTYICKNTEPMHTINERSACEIKLSIGYEPLHLERCEIKIIKLHDTYWTRLSTTNAWLFSTNSYEHIFISCKQSFDYNMIINNTGVLYLPQGCTAQTKTIRLVASREIKVKAASTVFKGTHLNIMTLLNDSQFVHTESLQNLLNETNIIKGISAQNNIAQYSLHYGKDLKDIMIKARKMGEYKSVSYKIDNMQTSFAYTVGGIIVVIILMMVICRFTALGGSLLLICGRIISERAAQQQEPSVKYTKKNTDEIYQRQHRPKGTSISPAGSLFYLDKAGMQEGSNN